MKYCSDCGCLLENRLINGDDFYRYTCEACGYVHYQNPKIVVGCIAVWNDKILLCRRAIEPGFGLWTLPAGYLENGESIQEGACRETMEETKAHVRIKNLISVIDTPFINQVYMFFDGNITDGVFEKYAAESLEVELFLEDEIPWNELAFSAVELTLKNYFKGRFDVSRSVYVDTIRKRQYS